MKHLSLLNADDDEWIVKIGDVSNAVFTPEQALSIAARQNQEYTNMPERNPAVRTRTTRGPQPSNIEQGVGNRLVDDPIQDRRTRHNSAINQAREQYQIARDAWNKANEELSKADPCAANHPSKVQAAVTATQNFLEASERMAEVCRRV